MTNSPQKTTTLNTQSSSATPQKTTIKNQKNTDPPLPAQFEQIQGINIPQKFIDLGFTEAAEAPNGRLFLYDPNSEHGSFTDPFSKGFTLYEFDPKTNTLIQQFGTSKIFIGPVKTAPWSFPTFNIPYWNNLLKMLGGGGGGGFA